MAVVTKTTQFQFLTKQVADIKVVNTSLQEQVAKNTQDITTLSGDIAQANSAVSNLKASGLKLGSAVRVEGSLLPSTITVDSTTADTIKAIDTVLVSVNAEIKQNAADIDKLEQKDTELAGEISTVSTSVTEEIARAKAAEEENAGAIADEKSRAEGAEKTISDSVTAMDTAYKAADTALSGRITTAQADIDAVEGRMDTAESDITSIKAQLGDGSGDGDSLIDRVAELEEAANISVTTDNSIIENVGTEETPDHQINADYMPELKFQGAKVGKLAKSINIVGVGNVSVDDDGNITLRLGENLNSSSFNTTDSKETSGVASASFTTTGTRTLADGTSKNIWLKGTNTVTVTTAGKIHFDDQTSLFKVTVNTKVFTFGPITGNGSGASAYVDADNSGAKLEVTNWGTEAKSATGATGYSANVKFTISMQDLDLADGMVSFSVEQVNATGATIGAKFTKSNAFYFVNDTTTKGDATAATVSLTNVTTKTLSGVSYIIGATVNYGATVANISNPATSGASKSTVSFDANGWANDTYIEVAYNATTASKTSSLVNGQHAAANTTVIATAKNVNGSDETATATLNIPLLVNNVALADDTNVNTVEVFKTESQRLKNDCTTAWTSTASLASTDGAEGLMVANGQLKYPAGNFTGYNDGLGGIVGSNQPNYTGLTGERSYVRKFTKTGSIPSATFSLVHTASIASFIDAAIDSTEKMVVEVSKDGSKWYDINTSGIGTARSLGDTSSSFTFEFTDGVATGGMFFRIRMASSSVTAVITKVTMA